MIYGIFLCQFFDSHTERRRNYINRKTKYSYINIIVALLIAFSSCGKKEANKEVTEEKPYFEGLIRPEIIMADDSAVAGQKFPIKVFLNNSDFKNAANKNGINDYLKVYYGEGEFGSLNSYKEEDLKKALLKSDTAYIDILPHLIGVKTDSFKYPFVIIMKIKFSNLNPPRTDTVFVSAYDVPLKNTNID